MKYCFLVGEIGINASGSVQDAFRMIDMAKECGLDFVKFQKRDVDSCYTAEELVKPRKSPFGTTTREQKEGIEFSIQDYKKIDNYCSKVGMKWFFSPWDCKSLKIMLENFDVPYIKVASALLTDYELLKKIEYSDKSIIMATGMATFDEVKIASQILKPNYILSCTSSYPTKTADLNFRKMEILKKEYSTINIGFSSHYMNHYAPIYAIANGASMVEFHITLDRRSYGSDQAASLEKKDIERIVRFRDFCSELKREEFWGCCLDEVPIKKKLRRK